MMTRLQNLSLSSTNLVDHQNIATVCQTEQLADLCYEMSAPGNITMLESTKQGRFSIYAITDDSTWQIEFSKGRCTVRHGKVTDEYTDINGDEMLQVMESFITRKKALRGVPEVPFWGGFVGFLSYEVGLELLDANVPALADRQSRIPQISLTWIDRSLVVDHQECRTTIQSLRKDDSWVQEMVLKLQRSDLISSTLKNSNIGNVLPATRIKFPEHDTYVSRIRSCQSELLAGNSYELCLTTEALVTTPTAPHNSYLLYKNLKHHNPVPFAAYLHLNQTTLISSSPEKFLAWSRTGEIDMMPMKGTVKKTPSVTLEKATEILSSAKERAENLMIADLIRHDLYSSIGGEDAKVEVVKLCEIVEHETVYQLVSHIRAHAPLSENMSPEETQIEVIKHGHRALRNTLPPGSMTGAPKKRSCEILSRLEQRSRKVYSGVIGYMDVGGGGSWSVCIRSAFSNGAEDRNEEQTWHVGAGGAITVLSDDEQEWEEMMTKLESVLRAFQPPEKERQC